MTSRPAPGSRFAFQRLSVHRIDFCRESRTDGIPPQFAHHRQESAFGREFLAEHGEVANLTIVRKLWIQTLQRGSYLGGLDWTRHQRAEKTAPVADHNNLLSRGQEPGQFLFDGLGSNLVAGIEHNQVLDAPDDPPIPTHIHFTLIPGMEPAIPQHSRRFFRTVPISRKNIRPADQDLLVFRSEEHTSELQSQSNLVCRLLLE